MKIIYTPTKEIYNTIYDLRNNMVKKCLKIDNDLAHYLAQNSYPRHLRSGGLAWSMEIISDIASFSNVDLGHFTFIPIHEEIDKEYI